MRIIYIVLTNRKFLKPLTFKLPFQIGRYTSDIVNKSLREDKMSFRKLRRETNINGVNVSTAECDRSKRKL